MLMRRLKNIIYDWVCVAVGVSCKEYLRAWVDTVTILFRVGMRALTFRSRTGCLPDARVDVDWHKVGLSTYREQGATKFDQLF